MCVIPAREENKKTNKQPNNNGSIGLLGELENKIIFDVGFKEANNDGGNNFQIQSRLIAIGNYFPPF